MRLFEVLFLLACLFGYYVNGEGKSPHSIETVIDHLHTGNLSAALLACDQFLDANSANSEAQMLKGITLMKLGQPSNALHWLQRASQASPDDPNILGNLAILHLKLGNLAEFVTAIRRKQDVCPDCDIPQQFWSALYLLVNGFAGLEHYANRPLLSVALSRSLPRSLTLASIPQTDTPEEFGLCGRMTSSSQSLYEQDISRLPANYHRDRSRPMLHRLSPWIEVWTDVCLKNSKWNWSPLRSQEEQSILAERLEAMDGIFSNMAACANATDLFVPPLGPTHYQSFPSHFSLPVQSYEPGSVGYYARFRGVTAGLFHHIGSHMPHFAEEMLQIVSYACGPEISHGPIERILLPALAAHCVHDGRPSQCAWKQGFAKIVEKVLAECAGVDTVRPDYDIPGFPSAETPTPHQNYTPTAASGSNFWDSLFRTNNVSLISGRALDDWNARSSSGPQLILQEMIESVINPPIPVCFDYLLASRRVDGSCACRGCQWLLGSGGTRALGSIRRHAWAQVKQYCKDPMSRNSEWFDIVCTPSDEPLVVVISRKCARGRCMLNEAELVESIETRLFEVGNDGLRSGGVRVRQLDFEWSTFAEQVGVMLRSNVLVGVSGAAFINTIFMRPGTAVVELFPHYYMCFHYYGSLADQSGLLYYGVYESERPASEDMPRCIDPSISAEECLQTQPCRQCARSSNLRASVSEVTTVVQEALVAQRLL